MEKTTKRLTALLLCMIMLVSLCPPALALDEENDFQELCEVLPWDVPEESFFEDPEDSLVIVDLEDFSDDWEEPDPSSSSEPEAEPWVFESEGPEQIVPDDGILSANSSGWTKVGSRWYYYLSNGTPAVGWWEIDSVWYYFAADGAMQTGWQKISNAWYYFAPGGAMQTGWQKISNAWYYFAPGGAMQTGWQKIGNAWYYFAPGGAMQTGWQKIGNAWYYFAPGGVMQTGWQKIGNAWYYFAPGGVMQTGWQKIDGSWYYFKSNGVMAANEIIDGYQLDENGRWIRGVKPDEALTRDNLIALLDAYDPDGAYIIRNSSESLCLEWFGSAKTIREGIDDMGTAVHEQCHDFTGSAPGWRYNPILDKYSSASEYIYVGNNNYIDVAFTDVYDSQEMVDSIPDSLRTFRFDTYVDSDNEYMASRQHGAYGLLNEFTAYYWGFHNNWLMDDYVQEYDLDCNALYSNEFLAYAEFRFYILRYMLYAKDNYPDVYAGILANDSFRSAFTSIETQFGALVATYREGRWIYSGFESEYTALMTEMEKPEYVQMVNLLKP